MAKNLTCYAAHHHIPLLRNEPLCHHTTFRIGGGARYYIHGEAAHLPALVQAAEEDGLPIALVGNGSNILAADEGYDGLVLRLKGGAVFFCGADTLCAPSGTSLSVLSMAAQRHGLTGLEFAQGIPGTVGGAVYMNAGAYGGQISDTLVSTTYFDLSNPQQGLQQLKGEAHAFSYRTSYYKEHPQLIIVDAVFRLKPGNPWEIADTMREYARLRKEKQPLDLPNAGSIFKRPSGHFAGALIEECGLKGFAIGGAQVSEKHAGFIVNTGGATAAEVIALMEKIERVVFSKTGVALEREIHILGCD